MRKTFGDIIRHWRSVRRFSQLTLSAETGISSRHISFLETGRSKPSRGSVLTFGRVLEMPKPIINDALLAAGFAPEYPAHDLSDVNLKPMMDAVAMILENHAPFPAIIIDGDWQIVGGNVPAMHMMQFLPLNGSTSVVDALLNDDPDNPVFLNWDVIATWTLTRLQLEASRLGSGGTLLETSKKLANDPRFVSIDQNALATNAPYLTMTARIDGQELSLFTMLAEFTTAQDVSMSERRVELFFPADDVTRIYFENMSGHLP
ncbi:MAG: helix-turn-helix transcriptional regulator [Litorimonas sp.]